MKEIRRENLRKLLSSPRFGGDRAMFCQDAKITKGRLAQLLDDDQPFGDAAAQNLCDKLDLPDNFFTRRDYVLEAGPGEYKLQGQQMQLTQAALQIAALYDLIPELDLIRRAKAYAEATTAILAVLEGHTPQPTSQPSSDQKKQSA